MDWDDAELGTQAVPPPERMPLDAIRHVASGVFSVPAEDQAAVSNSLVIEAVAELVTFDAPSGDRLWRFVGAASHSGTGGSRS